MSIPTLADHLAGTAKPAPRSEPTRVHRMGDGSGTPEHLPKHTAAATKEKAAAIRSPPFPPVTPTPNPATITSKEQAMPTGVYPRKPRAQQAPGDPAASKPSKRRTKKVDRAPRRKSDGLPVGAASFVIDDRGGMEIRDGQQSVKLERSDVGRLTLFLERTKGIRG